MVDEIFLDHQKNDHEQFLLNHQQFFQPEKIVLVVEKYLRAGVAAPAPLPLVCVYVGLCMFM